MNRNLILRMAITVLLLVTMWQNANGGTLVTFTPTPPNPSIDISIAEDQVTVTWSENSRLETATTIKGSWRPAPPGWHSPAPISLDRYENLFLRAKAVPEDIQVHVPDGYSDDTIPLVLVLHGAGTNGDYFRDIWGYDKLSDQYGFLCIHPNGSKSVPPSLPEVEQGWDWEIGKDSERLVRIIQAAQSQFLVDPKRIYVIGGSLGGQKALEIAMVHGDLLASVACVASGGPRLPYDFSPQDTPNLLFVHGTNDNFEAILAVITLCNEQLGLEPTDRQFLNSQVAAAPVALDLINDDRLETKINAFSTEGTIPHSELWSVADATHLDLFWSAGVQDRMNPAIIEWLMAHPKP